jgi:hypothetical protein
VITGDQEVRRGITGDKEIRSFLVLKQKELLIS